MFEKFEKFMNKYFVPIANRMDKQPHLSAIKKAMVAMTPLLIIGSFSLIPDGIANMIPDTSIAQWIIANGDLITLPFSLGMGYMSLYVTVIIAYHLSQHYKVDTPGAITMALIAFLLLSMSFTPDGGLDTTYLSTKGLFVAMIASIIAIEVYRWALERKFTIRMPKGVPDFVSRSFEMIPVSIITVLLFLFIRIITLNTTGVLLPEIFTKLLAPFVGSMDNPISFLFLQMLSILLFFFGIHPSVLSPITGPISTQFLAENIAASQAGQAIPHFYTGGVISAFANFTGTGVTFGLVFWYLFSKSKPLKKIGQVSLVPALFGINEPIIFGAPIVLNPTFFLPFVIGGAIVGTFPAFLMHYGWLAKPLFNPPYVGVFLEGFLVNLDFRTIIVNAVQMLGSILIWYPFFKIHEKEILKKEIDAKDTISAEDAELIEDLDLDF